jgi:hypothetical protein
MSRSARHPTAASASPGHITLPGHGGAQPGDAHDLLHRGDLLGQDLLPGRGGLVRAAASGGGQRPDPAAAFQPGQRPVQGARLHATPLKPAMSAMIV